MNRAYKILVVLMIASYAILIFYSNSVNLTNLSKFESFILSFLSIIRDIFVFLVFSILIIWSIFNYKHSQRRFIANIFLFFSFAFPLSIIYISYEVDSVINNDTQQKSQLNCSSYKIVSKSDEIKSKKIASLCYVQKGRVIDIVDKNGSTAKYIPTKKDLFLRDKNIKIEKLKLSTKESIKKIYFFWISLLIVSNILGLISIRVKVIASLVKKIKLY